MVEYFKLEEVPDQQFFNCERYRASLSVTSCAGMWRDANHHGMESRYRCKTCPVGAMHAGELSASMSPLMGTCICARCHSKALRLIGKHLCVSCYNRQREWIAGKNAKGTRPSKMLPLHRRVLHYWSGKEHVVLDLDHSADHVELMVAALRDSKQKVRFAFHGAMKGTPKQLRLL